MWPREHCKLSKASVSVSDATLNRRYPTPTKHSNLIRVVMAHFCKGPGYRGNCVHPKERGQQLERGERRVQCLKGPARKPERDSPLGTVEVEQEGMASN